MGCGSSKQPTVIYVQNDDPPLDTVSCQWRAILCLLSPSSDCYTGIVVISSLVVLLVSTLFALWLLGYYGHQNPEMEALL